ncbi:MAG: hypothetical protein B7Z19_06535, partial [Polynucleobacter sp. 32-46-5]
MAELLEPVEITIPVADKDGYEKTYILSKFDAVAGREIVFQYPTSVIPKLGDYKLNEELMFKMMSYVAVPQDSGIPLRLTTRALVNNHVPDWETLYIIEKEMMKLNCSFFRNGRASNFFDDVRRLA